MSEVRAPRSDGTRALPTGTVTFLFTDIEGSTRLLQRLGERYGDALDLHHLLLLQAVETAGGTRVSTDGDAVFAVFRDAAGAVEAAVAAQRALSAQAWPGGEEVRVRMGLHTGEGRLGAENYVGIDVHRGARIAAAAHGGQVVLSDPTRALVAHRLPDGVTIRDLGEVGLRDLEHPERLSQLVIDGLLSEFEPLRSQTTRPNNLPAQLTSFVGRERQVAEVRAHLAGSRLVTLTGPGGTGKTRLSLEVATESLPEYEAGAFFVPLAPISDPALVPSTIAQALRIKEVGHVPILATLREWLGPKELLLVLDNFEQIVGAAPMVPELLAAAPRLGIIVTSREALRVSGEQEYAVPPLDVPDPAHLPPLGTLSETEAVALFALRARAVQQDFALSDQNAPAVAGITWRLDGLPLAIELAAARVKVFPPEALLRRLEHTLTLGGGRRDVPARQQTLRDLIGWSHDLLTEQERATFRRLGVFVGGWTLEAAETVLGDDLGIDVAEGVTSLVDKSLVRQGQALGDQPWFWMLQTIREFAAERLDESGDRPTVAERHAGFYLDLAERAEPHLTGRGEWLSRLDREHDNIRAATAWSIETGRANLGLRLGGALWRFWQFHSHLAEGRDHLATLLALPAGRDRNEVRAKALDAAGSLAYWQNDFPAAKAAYEESLAIREELGDELGTAASMYNLAYVAAIEQDFGRARQLFRRCRETFERHGDRTMAAWATMGDGLVSQLEGNLEVARRLMEPIVGIFRDLGDLFALSNALIVLGRILNELGELAAARAPLGEALDIAANLGDTSGVAGVMPDLAAGLLSEGRTEEAARVAGAMEMLRERAGGGAPPPLIRVPDPRAAASRTMDPAEFERAFAEGKELSVDEAVALARGGGPDPRYGSPKPVDSARRVSPKAKNEATAKTFHASRGSSSPRPTTWASPRTIAGKIAP